MYFKQVEEIVNHVKVCTQRCVKPGETFHTAKDGNVSLVFTEGGRVKWSFGGVYAVSPKRGQLSAMVRWDDGAPRIVYPRGKATAKSFGEWGFKPLRICVNKIEQVQVQTMDERVAIAEGVKSVEEYIALWKTINKAPGTRWEDNPLVWRLWFEVAA